MRNSYWTFGRLTRYSLTTVASGAVLFAPSAPAARSAESDSQPVIRVEEDWQLVLNDPGERVDSPQFHTVMSPFNHLDSYFAQVTWNYREEPQFSAGGLQLQSWDGDVRIRYRSVGSHQLSTEAETVTWTQALATDGSSLSFEIFDGHSATWGDFGKEMRIDAEANLPDLSSYTPEATAGNSCITYGRNRVDSLIITQVRRYGPDGLISVDDQPKVLYMIGDDEGE